MIELLYSPDCPNFEPTLSLLNKVLTEQQCDLEISLSIVATSEEAVKQRFLGSPSIRIGGKDIESADVNVTDFSLRCRRYKDGDMLLGCPPKSLIEESLKRYLDSRRND